MKENIDSNIKIDLIKRFDLENLGKSFIVQGFGFMNSKQYSKASELFKQGLDLVSCQCGNGWKDEYMFDFEKIVPSKTLKYSSTENSLDYYFTQAFLYSYVDANKQKELLNKGLDLILKYLKNNDCIYGYYIQGVLFSELKLNKQALDSFMKAKELGNLNCINYKIGVLKESIENDYGLTDLIETFISNPSSLCCAYHLSYNWTKRRLAFELSVPPSVHPHKNSLKINDLTGPTFIDEYKNILENEKSLIFEELLSSKNKKSADFFNYINDEREFLRLQKEIIKEKKRNKQIEDEWDRKYGKKNTRKEYINRIPINLDALDVDQYPPEFWDNLK
ncbi:MULTISPECIES: hypothetical protein [unclassified Maribacter]|uniref:hypothetical protein n=1 Tax=unclassified Maribacter TaxID=2615042 RepID=UPI0025797C9A|nr:MULTISPECIES: hypothetical protein [unclassified Maribacter]|tara:strand:- start:57 stop:1058 length:1002 start_codon:yes stop_codon:yes gene_type:complete